LKLGEGGEPISKCKIPNNVGAPACCPPPWRHPDQIHGLPSSAIACGASNELDCPRKGSPSGRCEWSDYPGPGGLLKPDLCAPGSKIRTCDLDASGQGIHIENKLTGTSAATPHVAGAIALLMEAAGSKKDQLTPAHYQEALEMTCEPMKDPTSGQYMQVRGRKINKCGSGRINVYEAWRYGKRKGWW
jgi:hypothetical protein